MPVRERYQKNIKKHRKANKIASRKYRKNKKVNDPEWWEKEMKRLKSLDETRGWQAIRFGVLNRDDFTCQYCGRKAPDVELHIDHKVPRSKGGSNNENNLVTACSDCNWGKFTKILKY